MNKKKITKIGIFITSFSFLVIFNNSKNKAYLDNDYPLFNYPSPNLNPSGHRHG